jgi:hypothetical protein
MKLLFALSVFLSMAAVHTAQSKLLIAEIMAKPVPPASYVVQWFELYNDNDKAVDLSDRNVTTTITMSAQGFPDVATNVSANVIVQPYESIVVGNGADAGFKSLYNISIPFQAFKVAGLQSIGVCSTTGCDTLSWDLSLLVKLSFPTDGSLAKNNLNLPTSDVKSWTPSTTFINCVSGFKGTPGRNNSYVCPTKAPVTAKPVTAKPVTAKPITAKPITAKPITAKPVTAKPVTAKPIAPVAPAPLAQAPVGTAPVSTPVASAPMAKAPVAAAPVSSPVSSAPVIKAPVAAAPTSNPIAVAAPVNAPTPVNHDHGDTCVDSCRGGLGIAVHKMKGAVCKEGCQVLIIPRIRLGKTGALLPARPRRGWECGKCH